MPFETGKSGNEAGRPKGSRNKAGEGLRNLISDFLQENFEQVKIDFAQLEPRDRIRVYTDLLKFSLPVLQATTITNDLQAELETLNDEQLETLTNRILEHHSQ